MRAACYLRSRKHFTRDLASLTKEDCFDLLSGEWAMHVGAGAPKTLTHEFNTGRTNSSNLVVDISDGSSILETLRPLVMLRH
jgi:hypothetical protein